MRKSTRLLLFINIVFLIPAAQSYAQPKVGDLKLEFVKPQAAQGQEIVYQDENKQEIKVEYGTLTVPERHAAPNGKLIELAFFRLKSNAKNPGAPIVFLEGGPGLAGTNAYYGPVMKVFIKLLAVADVIILDQRGTGHSKPNMICRDIPGLLIEEVATYDALLRNARQRNRQCAERLSKQGVDLAAYNLNESADDLEVLRKAIGARKINLLGFSGGATLALTMMRRHPDSLAHVVMAGIESTAQMNKLPSNLQRQLQQIDQLVKADAKINKLVPDLLGLMKSVLDQFETQPVTVELSDPATKQKYKVRVGKYLLQALTTLMIGTTEDIKLLPIFYYALSKGELSLLQGMLSRQNNPRINATAFLIDCASGVSRERQAQIHREAKETLLGDAINFPFPEGCDVWGAPDLGDEFRGRVESKVPTLLISGTLDGFTPVSNAEEARQGLSNSTLLVIEGAGHEDLLTGLPAVAEIIRDFMQQKPITVQRINFPVFKFRTSSD